MSIEAMKRALQWMETMAHADKIDYSGDHPIAALRAAIAEAEQPKCSDHPDAPHGFDRTASHSLGRYVCECEGWSRKPEAGNCKAEPVLQVWRSTDSCEEFWSWDDCDEYDYAAEENPENKRKLYLHPPRQWIGLTEDEIQSAYAPEVRALVRSIEAKLREKNT